MAQTFSTSCQIVPVKDVGLTTPRVIRQKLEITIGDRALTLGDQRVPYSEIRSAEMHRIHSWPLTSYLLALVVGEELISFRVSKSAAQNGFPFPLTVRDVYLEDRARVRRRWELWAALSLLVLLALSWL
jgi:hypothetical protein